MNNSTRFSTCLIISLGVVTACAEPRAVSSATGTEPDPAISEVARDSEQPESPSADKRLELEEMARETVDRLVSDNQYAHDLYEQSDYYAVFESTKVGMLVTGAGGTGVAVDRNNQQCVYMRMGAAGLGLGGGIQKYKLVFLFEDENTFDDFIRGQWDGNTAAQAVAGKAAVEGTSNFVDGLAVYQLTDAGLIAQADLTLMKFWQDDNASSATESDALRCVS